MFCVKKQLRACKVYILRFILLVKFKVATTDALRGTFAIAAESVALGVAVVQNGLSVDRPFGGSLRV